MHLHAGWKLKRSSVTLMLVFTTVTASMGANSNGAADSGPVAASAGNASSANSAAANATVVAAKGDVSASGAGPMTESQFEELRGLIETQGEQLKAAQEKILELEAALHPGSAEPAAVPIAAPIAAISSPAVAPAPQAGQDFGKRLDGLETRLKNFGPFSLAGDVRVRNEPYFGGPVNSSQVRDRERYRARLQFNARLNDDFSGGIGLSTGDLNDPISSNQTANQFFTRKPFALDRAFINYTPHQFSPLTLTGGKFVFPAYKTQLTWDEDIFPEGVAEKLEWKSDDWHVLRQFALIGFQLPFAETQNTEAVKTFTRKCAPERRLRRAGSDSLATGELAFLHGGFGLLQLSQCRSDRLGEPGCLRQLYGVEPRLRNSHVEQHVDELVSNNYRDCLGCSRRWDDASRRQQNDYRREAEFEVRYHGQYRPVRYQDAIG
jgi:Putative porin